MEGTDRFASLAVAAQVSGALDFGRSSRYDGRWLLKESLVLRHLEAENMIRLYESYHILHSGAVSAGASGEVYQHHFKQATDQIRSMGRLLLPWVDWDDKDNFDSWKSKWEKEFGIKVGSKEWDDLVARYDKMNKIRTAATNIDGAAVMRSG